MLLLKLLLLIMPIYIQAMSLGDFICQSAKICGRPPTVQEFCDVFDLCFDGIKKTPPTPIEVLNKKLNMTNICNEGLSMVDVEIIQRQYAILFSPSIATLGVTNPTTTTRVPTTTIPYVPVGVEPQPLSPEIITLIVLGSVAGLGLLVGLGFVIKRKMTN